MTPVSEIDKSTTNSAHAAYYATVLLLFLGSFFPEHRVWGINSWAYIPEFWRYSILLIALVVPVIYRYIPWLKSDENIQQQRKIYSQSGIWLPVVLLLAVGSVLWIFRVKVHFLGDGYTSLSYLALDNPLVRSRELGESLIHIWLKSAIGGNPHEAALLSFQIISVTAGMFFIAAVVLFSRAIFDRKADMILFSMGMASGGYMLLFFGYVEYYSMFVLSMLGFSLIGSLIALGKIKRVWIVPLLAAAIFFHILGLVLVPGAVYLFFTSSRASVAMSRISARTKLLLLFFFGLTSLLVFYGFYMNSWFFRFAFVPLVENRFTVDGYTLFSLSHLADCLNLLLLLLPALPVVLAILLFSSWRAISGEKIVRFLGLVTFSVLGAAFIFDPKMGMPRDWDLFSFAGIPLSVLAFYLIITVQKRAHSYAWLPLLLITLGFLSLIPRVIIHNTPESSIAQFEDYIALDKKKCAKGRNILVSYYSIIGDTVQSRIEGERFLTETPEMILFRKGMALQNNSKFAEATAVYYQLTQMNPSWQDAWANLGFCYQKLHQLDEAKEYMEIGVGINPYSAATWHNLGTVYLELSDYKRSEHAFLRALELDSSIESIHRNLIGLYKHLYRKEEYLPYLIRAAAIKDSPLIVFTELGEYYLQRGNMDGAKSMFTNALSKGLDSIYVDNLISKYPGLK